jgi:hypothetical protein
VPQLVIVAGDRQTDTVGRTLAAQIQARLTDALNGAPLPGRIVNWIVVEGGGSVFAPVGQTGSDGVARQTWTLGMTVGKQKLVARWIDPETGATVTLDSALATALPGWNFTILVTNRSTSILDLSWRDGAAGTGSRSIGGGQTVCQRIAVRSDSVSFSATTGSRTITQPAVGWFSPLAHPAYTMDVSDPGAVILYNDVATQC